MRHSESCHVHIQKLAYVNDYIQGAYRLLKNFLEINNCFQNTVSQKFTHFRIK